MRPHGVRDDACAPAVVTTTRVVRRKTAPRLKARQDRMTRNRGFGFREVVETASSNPAGRTETVVWAAGNSGQLVTLLGANVYTYRGVGMVAAKVHFVW